MCHLIVDFALAKLPVLPATLVELLHCPFANNVGDGP